MLSTFISAVHVVVCVILMFVVLLQQGKGGGMGSAFGGASAQVFGGSGAGNILTRATAICAGIFMLTSVTLAYLSSAKDSGLRAKIAQEEQKAKDRGTKRDKSTAPATPATTGSTAPSAGGSMMNAPGPGTTGGTTPPAPVPAP
ncbi:MAG: Preprotein translocase subunit SecG [Labilithrix sp.]|nr:Preprotein translocase subunit SecG [Labilithrix sp.]